MLKIILMVMALLVTSNIYTQESNKGKELISQKKFDEAITCFENEISKNDENDELYLNLAKAYYQALNHTSNPFKQSKYASKMKRAYLDALKINPKNLEARIGLANFYINAPFIVGGSIKKGKKEAEIVKKQDIVLGSRLMASIFEKEGETENAIKEYLLLDKNGYAEPIDLYNIGYKYQAQKDWENAFIYFKKALKLDKNHCISKYQYARTSVFSNKYTINAIAYLKDFISNCEKVKGIAISSAYWRLGMLYEHQYDIEKAKNSYKNAMKIDSTNERAKKAYNKLNN